MDTSEGPHAHCQLYIHNYSNHFNSDGQDLFDQNMNSFWDWVAMIGYVVSHQISLPYNQMNTSSSAIAYITALPRYGNMFSPNTH